MLQHVYERVSLARYLTSVVIATDDQRIYDEARRFGGAVRMTRPDHLSGTDRVAEVASSDPAEWIVNVQGDEPLIDPGAIDAAILPLLVVAAFAQYIADSYWGHRGGALRGSALGRWNGILYFAPLGGDVLVRLGLRALEQVVTVLAWALVVSTLLSMIERLWTLRSSRLKGGPS